MSRYRTARKTKESGAPFRGGPARVDASCGWCRGRLFVCRVCSGRRCHQRRIRSTAGRARDRRRSAAAQLGPIQKADTRPSVVERLIAFLRDAHESGCKLVAFPELALTTFFPRYFMESHREIDAYFEREMPNDRIEHYGLITSQTGVVPPPE